MFVLIWVTLLCSVTGSSADTDAGMTTPVCLYGFCISLGRGEIKAEAGLCTVIHCSFTTAFSPIASAVWHKCDESKIKCDYSDIIFHSRNQNEIQPGFRGRVSLLEPNLYRGNCSIVINDLDQSDSGSYQFKVTGWLNQRYERFTFSTRASVSVKALTQKPTVEVPALTEGQQTTLTCTAPGLCSGSDPIITWTWRRSAEDDSYITGNITTTHGRNSSLTFTPSAKHHSTEVTCKVNFRGNKSTQETVTLNVTYVKEMKMTENISVKERDTLNLTCSIDSFPPALVMWQKPFGKNVQNVIEVNLQNDTELLNRTETTIQVDTGSATVIIYNVTAEHSGQYICTVEYINNTLMGKVDVKVIYMREPVITGDRRVKRGDVLNLTCSFDSFPPSVIIWAKLGPSGTNTNLQNDTGSATLVIHDMTADDSGQYMCTGQYQGKTSTAYVDITVFLLPEILKSSGCVSWSEVLTCVCVSEGLPLPTITWPLLDKHTEYSGTYTVSKYTINRTITVKVKELSSTDVQCVSTNEYGEAVENLIIRTSEKSFAQENGGFSAILLTVTVVSLIVNILLIVCLIFLWNSRKKLKQNQEDQTYLTLSKRDISPDVVAQQVSASVD
ncbi:sialic acid-binding Ig-like lectin 10 isoform X2 [Sphaeramia orbicularis]|uniref:sialic acid-binding Ig-like lectin 10 isoform X2 n=1 Tax=Sphaeramia orbicularis TaxID=375764 RepID=UPI001180142E|nr:sialic acid-binding Ig-like lectin 10 isoform X2 [Sphaeramia orbicularis]